MTRRVLPTDGGGTLLKNDDRSEGGIVAYWDCELTGEERRQLLSGASPDQIYRPGVFFRWWPEREKP